MALVGAAPWAVFVSANSKYWPEVPWAVPATALCLWLFWRYVRGEGWPRSTSETRHTLSRVNRLPKDVWIMALFAGALGLVTIVLLQTVTSRIVTLPKQQDFDASNYPLITVVFWVLMSSIVAGVVEETSFRGYIQGPIERRYGPVIAILMTGGLFGFAHFTHPEVTFILLPYYLAVAAVYGSLAYLTNSILPGMVLHAGGNMLGTFDLLARGRSEWHAPASSEPLIWQTGTDAAFWVSCVAFLLVGVAAVRAYVRLARGVRGRGSIAP